MINVIPGHTFGPANTPISLPGYETLNETAPTPSEQQLTLAAANAPLRFGYGVQRIAPLVANALVDAAGALLLDCVLGEGPMGSLVAMEINDAAAPAGVTVTYYDGTQVLADPTLVAAWLLQGVAYTDVRPGVAYAVLKIPANVDLTIDERSITFQVQMRKVYDPRVLFRQVQSDLATGWTDTNAPGYVPNSMVARDGSMTAHALYDSTPGTLSGRYWSWVVANDTKTRSISISINKAGTTHTPGVGVFYSGGSTVGYAVKLNTITGVATLHSGSGGAVQVVDWPEHWEVVVALANNGSGNTAFTLVLYPNLI